MKARAKAAEKEESTRFVRLVRKHPCLYNFRLPEYSQRDAVEQAWKSIGAELRVDHKGLKDRWRNYRTVYLRRYKAQKQGVAQTREYYLMDEMKFLDAFIKVTVPLNPLAKGNSKDRKSPVQPAIVFLEKEEKTDLERFQEEEQSQLLEEKTTEMEEEGTGTGYPAEYFTTTITPNKSLAEFIDFSGSSYAQGIKVENTGSATATTPRKLFVLSVTPEIERLSEKKYKKFRKMCMQFLDDSDADE